MERLIEDRRAQFQREKEAELAERKEEEERQEQRRAIIEQERQRLLQEHAAKLLGYLPKVCIYHIVYIHDDFNAFRNLIRGVYSGLLIRGVHSPRSVLVVKGLRHYNGPSLHREYSHSSILSHTHSLSQGVLRDSRDLDLLSPDFKEAYQRRQVDPFADL